MGEMICIGEMIYIPRWRDGMYKGEMVYGYGIAGPRGVGIYREYGITDPIYMPVTEL